MQEKSADFGASVWRSRTLKQLDTSFCERRLAGPKSASGAGPV
ncbi:hypothetical protein U91I_00798 [alpha proteobacterium U9-1i]|nr:hypothetical protein U91I_00798 [alpha proteobacterium U9-1i]